MLVIEQDEKANELYVVEDRISCEKFEKMS
jgi:hypothetical protein